MKTVLSMILLASFSQASAEDVFNGPQTSGVAIPLAVDRAYSFEDVKNILCTCHTQVAQSVFRTVFAADASRVQCEQQEPDFRLRFETRPVITLSNANGKKLRLDVLPTWPGNPDVAWSDHLLFQVEGSSAVSGRLIASPGPRLKIKPIETPIEVDSNGQPTSVRYTYNIEAVMIPNGQIEQVPLRSATGDVPTPITVQSNES